MSAMTDSLYQLAVAAGRIALFATLYFFLGIAALWLSNEATFFAIRVFIRSTGKMLLTCWLAYPSQ